MKTPIFNKNFLLKIFILSLLMFVVTHNVSRVSAINDKATQSLESLKSKARVAIIIDDVGEQLQPAEELLQIPAQLTWSVLPYRPYTKELALAGQKHGFEILLHLPMASIHGKINPGPGMIDRNWSKEKMLGQLEADLQEVPDATGINNHMGSVGRNDLALMTVLMQELKKRHLFYVDSLTDFSLAENYASQYRVPFAKRDVFIDHYRDLTANEDSIRQLIRIASRKGFAIGIGHAREGTATEIKDMLPEFSKAGVAIVPVSELVSPHIF